MAQPEPLWTPADTARRLNKPAKTLAEWRSRRIGPPWMKLEGGSVRYDPVAVEEWLQQQTVPA